MSNRDFVDQFFGAIVVVGIAAAVWFTQPKPSTQVLTAAQQRAVTRVEKIDQCDRKGKDWEYVYTDQGTTVRCVGQDR